MAGDQAPLGEERIDGREKTVTNIRNAKMNEYNKKLVIGGTVVTIIEKGKKRTKTYNTGDSLVVTDPTTNPAISGLSMGERTGSRAFQILWSYVKALTIISNYMHGLHQAHFGLSAQPISTHRIRKRKIHGK